MRSVSSLLAVLVGVVASVAFAAEQPWPVTVSIPPQAYVVEQVAGKLARVSVLLPDGKSPHDYAPSPSQVVALAGAKIYFTIGLPFEQVIVDKMRGQTAGMFVDMAAGIKKIPAEDDEHHHDHAKGGAHHHHEGDDPHVWTSPSNLILMAENAAAAFARIDPAHAAVYRANCRKFVGAMTELDRRVAAELAPCRGRTVFVYHPAFGYFAARYGIRQEAIEEQGKDPSPQQIMKLIGEARKDGVKVILVQKQFNSRSAETIARAIGGRVLAVDNLQFDVPAMIREIASAVRLGVTGK